MLSTCVEVGPVVELDGSARRLRNTGVKTQQRSRAESSRERPLGHLQRRRRHVHRAVHVVVGEVDVERRRRCLDQPALPHASLPTVADDSTFGRERLPAASKTQPKNRARFLPNDSQVSRNRAWACVPQSLLREQLLVVGPVHALRREDAGAGAAHSAKVLETQTWLALREESFEGGRVD